jgi:arabinan endo-1,5-alpha-L-arabinosidase
MYYVISKLGTQDSEIGVATSQTMEPGSWTDHGAVGIPANGEYNRIDPNWISIGGQSYLNFGSYWNDIFQIEMQGPLQATNQEPRNLAFNGSLNHREEGSFMFQNGNWFYLLFSAGIANAYTATYPAPGEEYSIRMCRSQSGFNGFVRSLHSLLALSTNTLFSGGHARPELPRKRRFDAALQPWRGLRTRRTVRDPSCFQILAYSS